MEPWKFRPARDLGLPMGERLKSHRRECGLVQSGLHMAWWSAVRGYLRVFHRLKVEGAEHLPAKPPFVLVANHASHLDALALAAPLGWRLWDRVFSLAAGDTFFATRSQAAFASLFLNALPVWRKSQGMTSVQTLRERLLEDPCGLILFPEGTRSRTGEMSAFKPGVGMLVAGADVPVVPCLLTGAYQAWPPGYRAPRPRRVTLRVGPALSFADAPNNRKGWTESAARLEAAVRALHPDPAMHSAPPSPSEPPPADGAVARDDSHYNADRRTPESRDE